MLVEHAAEPVVAEEDAASPLRFALSHRGRALKTEDPATLRGLTVLVGMGLEAFILTVRLDLGDRRNSS